MILLQREMQLSYPILCVRFFGEIYEGLHILKIGAWRRCVFLLHHTESTSFHIVKEKEWT